MAGNLIATRSDMASRTVRNEAMRRGGSALASPTMAPNDRWNNDDVIAADLQARSYAVLEGPMGLELLHRSSGTRGTVVAFTEGARIIIEDPVGGRHEFKPFDGSFSHHGTPVALRTGITPPKTAQRRFTASGSVDTGPTRAKVAAASRIWVEGIHDAELIERIWGDDLRVEGVVVEPMHGVDDLPQLVAAFHPGPQRRLGILLDHVVDGSKEARLAERVQGPHVLVTGHPYVDVWQAIRPASLGIAAWPAVPMGTPWKEGIVAALGVDATTGRLLEGGAVRCLHLERCRNTTGHRDGATHRLRDGWLSRPPKNNAGPLPGRRCSVSVGAGCTRPRKGRSSGSALWRR